MLWLYMRHKWQGRTGGDRARPNRDRGVARERRIPARRILDDAAEAEPDLQRGDHRASSVAIHQVPIFLSSMQAVHERATGEWQAEWDTMPLLFALTAAALALLTDLLAGLQVDRVRMRANLELDGGQIMAEAVMMAAAPLVGRDRAHALVYSASTRARRERMSLADTLRDDLSPELQAQIDLEHVLAPGSYTGDAEVVRGCRGSGLADEPLRQVMIEPENKSLRVRGGEDVNPASVVVTGCGWGSDARSSRGSSLTAGHRRDRTQPGGRHRTQGHAGRRP